MASEKKSRAGGAAAQDSAIVSRRVIPARREEVFAAHADPARLAAWWGPGNATNEFECFDFRPGGDWRFTMRFPGGEAFPMVHRFEEIVAPERIVVRHIQAGHDFTLTIRLAEVAGGTEVGWHMAFDDPGEAQRLRGFLTAANMENLERLATHLGPTMSGNPGAVR